MPRNKHTAEQVAALRSLGLTGGSKSAELDRSAEMVREITATRGVGMALWLLVDSGYDNADIRAVAERLTRKPSNL